jgi:phosphatidylglycerophosphatase A
MPPPAPTPPAITPPAPATTTRPPRTTWAWTLGTFFGAGLLKPGPGTWGSVAATLLWLACVYLLHPTPIQLTLATLAGTILAVAIGIPAGTIIARESARKDPGHVVIDEVAGVLLALLACAWPLTHPNSAPTVLTTTNYADWPHALAALLFFRLFDILKPPPARQLERLPAGTGIMLDDLAAGIYAAIGIRLVSHWAHWL